VNHNTYTTTLNANNNDNINIKQICTATAFQTDLLIGTLPGGFGIEGVFGETKFCADGTNAVHIERGARQIP